jgi:hypothetical protein
VRALSGGEETEDTSARVQLLSDIRTIFNGRKEDSIRSVDLIKVQAPPMLIVAASVGA